MTKRTVALWVFLAILLAGCRPENSPPRTKADAPVIIHKIVVGLDANFPPMGFRNEKNELAGFDVDMAQEAGKRLGIPIELKAIDWVAKDSELFGKRVDVLWSGLVITEERKKTMAFTAPYLQNHQIVVVAANSTIRHRADLAGKVVGAQEGSSAVQVLRQEPALFASFQAFRVFGDNLTPLELLTQGRLQAVFMDEVVGRNYALRKPDQYAVLDTLLGSEHYAVGLRPEDTLLREKLNEVLATMQKEGATKRIAQQWFGKNFTP